MPPPPAPARFPPQAVAAVRPTRARPRSARMWSGVEKVDSAGGGSQHRDAARLRQLRALRLTLLVAVFAAAPLAAQQEQQRVVRGLSFEGNHAIDDYTLSTAIGTSNSSWFARAFPIRLLGLGEKRVFNELEFRRDVIRLLLLYRQSGYMNAVIDTLVRREGRDVYLKFRIYEGDPVRLARLDMLGVDSILDVRRLKRDLPLQEGDPFNRALFQASADTVVSRLKNLGYPYADILRNYDVDVAALRAVATLEALPGRRMRVGQVLITGTEKVDTATVRRMLSVRAGDWFRQDRLYLTQRDLYGLGMFRSVNVALADTTPPPGDSAVRVLVRVAEAPRHRIRFGAGYGSLDCFRVQSGWTAYDFLGGARSLDLTGQLSKLGVGVPANAGFKQNVCQPLHDDPPHGELRPLRRAALRVQGVHAPGRGREPRGDVQRPARRPRHGGVQLLGGPHDRGTGRVVRAVPPVQRVRPGVPPQHAAVRGDHDLRRARASELGARSLGGERDAGDPRPRVALRPFGHLVRVQPRGARDREVLPAVAPQRVRLADPGRHDRAAAHQLVRPECQIRPPRPALLRRRP